MSRNEREDVRAYSLVQQVFLSGLMALLAFPACLPGEPKPNMLVTPVPGVSTGVVVNGSTAPVGTNALWFPVGETLTYGVYWGFISVGEAVVTSSWIEDGGVRYLQIVHRIRSNRALAVLYPVDDTIQTLIDPVTFRPVSFFMDQKEGRFSAKEVTTFDYGKGVARWESFTKKKTAVYPIDQDTRDLVTFMYFMRRDGFKPGADRQFRVMADDKVYDLGVKVVGEEKVDVPGYGKVDCLRLDPTAKFNGLFVRKGKMTVWVSYDRRFLCTRVAASVPIIGTVKIILTSVGGPGDDTWIKKTGKADSPANR